MMTKRQLCVGAWLVALGMVLACAPTASPSPSAGAGGASSAGAPTGLAEAPPARVEPATAPAPPSGPKEEIVFGIPQRNLNYIVPMAAKAFGFFDDVGLDVDVRELPSNLTIAAMQRGDMQISGSGGSAIRAAVQGAPFKVIAFMTVRPTFYLISVPGVRTAQQLVGKRIGVNNVASTQQKFTEQFLREQGVDPSEVVFIGMGSSPPAYLAALQAGAIDAAVFDAAAAAVAEGQGLYLLKSLGEVAPVPLQGLVVTEEYLQQRPATVRAFLEGLVRGLLYAKQHPREVAAVAQQELGLEMDDTTAIRAVQLYADTISAEAPGYADAQLMEAFYEFDVRIPLELPADQKLPVMHDFARLLDAYDALKIPRPR
jgi:NitT/TauT family transport system substrate-binding protein